MRVSVHPIPEVRPVPAGADAVIVDVLRATTTLTAALVHGAARVIPAATPDQARALARDTPEALLCGERDGLRIPGFDLGNSPAEYAESRVRGRALVFASTNGARALIAAAPARRRVLGCFANASATLESVARSDRVVIVCAGQLGRTSLEDLAFAGWLCAALASRGALLDDAGRLARAIAPADAFAVRAVVEGASHGRYLRRLGGPFARDVALCGTLDHFDRAFAV